jgi:mRNA interferase RelE/StbE
MMLGAAGMQQTEIFDSVEKAFQALSKIWAESTSADARDDSDLVFEEFDEQLLSANDLVSSNDIELDFDFSDERRPPEWPTAKRWLLSFSADFLKAIASIDKNQQARVLKAIAEISEEPEKRHGDTVKPLVGKLKGWWRYRIGDFRLVYEPMSVKKIVVLHDFASRGGVYE